MFSLDHTFHVEAEEPDGSWVTLARWVYSDKAHEVAQLARLRGRRVRTIPTDGNDPNCSCSADWEGSDPTTGGHAGGCPRHPNNWPNHPYPRG